MPVPVTQWLPAATRSAIIVPVPETDHLVAWHRRALSPSPATVPAHVTVLYPFVHPSMIGAGTIVEIEQALLGISPFECAFTQVKWFGEEVVWLAPKPDEHSAH